MHTRIIMIRTLLGVSCSIITAFLRHPTHSAAADARHAPLTHAAPARDTKPRQAQTHFARCPLRLYRLSFLALTNFRLVGLTHPRLPYPPPPPCHQPHPRLPIDTFLPELPGPPRFVTRAASALQSVFTSSTIFCMCLQFTPYTPDNATVTA